MGEMYRPNRPKYNLKDRHLLKNNIEVSVKFSEGRDERNIHGTIENCYIVSDFDKESGELIYGNDKYVLVPNGWDERLWHYKWYTGRIYWGGKNAQGESGLVQKTCVTNEQAYQDYHSLENHHEINKNKINTKLLIKIGEIDNVRDFDLVADNNITKDNSSNEARRKLMELYININRTVGATIKTKNEITKEIIYTDYPTIAELQFYADGRTLLVDWGDGTELDYYTGWENLTEYRYYSDKINMNRYRTRMRHIYKNTGVYTISIYGENNDSYKETFKFHQDYDKHQGLVQFFAEVPVRKELPVYDAKGKLTKDKKVVDAKMKFFSGLSIDGASVPREKDEKLFEINPDFYYTVKRPAYELSHTPYLAYEYDIDGLVQTRLDKEGKEFVVPDQPILDEAGGEYNRYSKEEKAISSTWLGSLINYQLNGRFEDIFENQDKTWWMILQRTGSTKTEKNKYRSGRPDVADCYFYDKNLVEDKNSWIHIYESTFENIYFKGERDSAYLDIYNIEYWRLNIHLCRGVKTLYVDHFPKKKSGSSISINVYSDTVFHVVDISGNMKDYIFYCKKELIDRFSNANPELTFKELIV